MAIKSGLKNYCCENHHCGNKLRATVLLTTQQTMEAMRKAGAQLGYIALLCDVMLHYKNAETG